jgi:hypothetical protein
MFPKRLVPTLYIAERIAGGSFLRLRDLALRHHVDPLTSLRSIARLRHAI